MFDLRSAFLECETPINRYNVAVQSVADNFTTGGNLTVLGQACRNEAFPWDPENQSGNIFVPPYLEAAPALVNGAPMTLKSGPGIFGLGRKSKPWIARNRAEIRFRFDMAMVHYLAWSDAVNHVRQLGPTNLFLAVQIGDSLLHTPVRYANFAPGNGNHIPYLQIVTGPVLVVIGKAVLAWLGLYMDHAGTKLELLERSEIGLFDLHPKSWGWAAIGKLLSRAHTSEFCARHALDVTTVHLFTYRD